MLYSKIKSNLYKGHVFLGTYANHNKYFKDTCAEIVLFQYYVKAVFSSNLPSSVSGSLKLLDMEDTVVDSKSEEPPNVFVALEITH